MVDCRHRRCDSYRGCAGQAARVRRETRYAHVIENSRVRHIFYEYCPRETVKLLRSLNYGYAPRSSTPDRKTLQIESAPTMEKTTSAYK